jgi:glycosyltransferase involved in cell wall biosynthesis
MRAPYVLMLGTALQTRGGVSSVACTYREQGLFARWNVVYLATHGSGTIVRKLCIMFGAIGSYAARLALHRPALVHIHVASRGSFWRKLVFFALARLARVPVLLHVHGGGFERFYDRSDAWLTQRLIRWTLTDAALVLALSPRWSSFFARVAPAARVAVLPNPVAPARVPSAGAIVGRISFLGRLTRNKGVFELLQAFAAASSGHPDAHLMLGGEGDRQAITECAQRLGIRQRVQLLGWVEGDAKDRLLASSSIFVLPSFIEGVPVCVLEAMSYGVPVVVSNVGGLPDIVGQEIEGLLVPPGDAARLADALRRLLDEPALARAMGERGRERARHEFEAPVVCAQLEQMYARLLGRSAPSCSTA